MDAARFARAVTAIDAANAEDPTEVTVGGRRGPKELLHAEAVTGWVLRLRPDASEALQLAARAHHFRRWESPRSSHPEGRAGYLRWRRDLSQRQAEGVATLLRAGGYDEANVARVQDIMRKRGLGTDPEIQALEDALCLVFLETQYDDLRARLARPHMIDVLAKTMGKMSPDGLALARGLALSEEGRALLAQAAAMSSGAAGPPTP